MNDGVGMVVTDAGHDGRGVGEAEVLDVDAAGFDAAGFQLVHGVPAQLSGITCDEYFH